MEGRKEMIVRRKMGREETGGCERIDIDERGDERWMNFSEMSYLM